MNFYAPYVAVLWLSFINIEYVEASLNLADLAAIVTDDAEASGCTVVARGYCVDQLTGGNQDVCSSLMSFYNCALTSVQAIPGCTANTYVTEYVQTIEMLMVTSTYKCTNSYECDSVFQACFEAYRSPDVFDFEDVDAFPPLTYSRDQCSTMLVVVHCLNLQQDTGCYPWLSDDTFDRIKDTIFSRCPDGYKDLVNLYNPSELWMSHLDGYQDLPDQCMSPVISCEITLYRSVVPLTSGNNLCSSFMSHYGCILKALPSFSTSCATNLIVEKYIENTQKIRLVLASICPNITDCNSELYDTCIGDAHSYYEAYKIDDIDIVNIKYNVSICSGFQRSVYCLDAINSGCTNDWLPSLAVRQMSDDLSDVFCARDDLPPSPRSLAARTLGSTRILVVVTIILYFIL